MKKILSTMGVILAASASWASNAAVSMGSMLREPTAADTLPRPPSQAPSTRTKKSSSSLRAGTRCKRIMSPRKPPISTHWRYGDGFPCSVTSDSPRVCRNFYGQSASPRWSLRGFNQGRRRRRVQSRHPDTLTDTTLILTIFKKVRIPRCPKRPSQAKARSRFLWM